MCFDNYQIAHLKSDKCAQYHRILQANEAHKKIIQIIGYKDGNYTRVEDAGILYSWNWENLKKLLS